MKRTLISLAFCVLSLGAASAQDTNHDGIITYLVPVNAPEPIAGARGTSWKTELWVHNGTGDNLTLRECGVVPCMLPLHAPDTTEVAFSSETLAPASRPVLFHIQANIARDVTLSSRLFELTRRAQPAGIHLPVIREDRFFTKPSRFIGIKSDESLRTAVRIYDPRAQSSTARIEVLSTSGQILGERTITLTAIDPLSPAHALISDLTAEFPNLKTISTYDVRVTPTVPGKEYWALVSVTDNETQQVMLITAD